MKILYIIPHFYPAISFGGPVAATYELAKGMVKKGHDVSVFTTNVLDSSHRIPVIKNTIEGVKVSYFPIVSTYLAYTYNIYIAPLFYYRLLRDIRNFDMIHIHELYTVENCFAAYLSCLKKIPFCLSAHGSLAATAQNSKSAVKKIFMNIAKYYYLNSKVFFSLSAQEKNDWMRLGASEKLIEIIPNGVVSVFQPKPLDVANFLDFHHIKKEQPIILYIGRLHKIKNLNLLLQSFRIVLGHVSNSILVLAGPDSGEYRKLKNLSETLSIEKQIKFIGVVDEKIKSILYSSASVFVLTSFTEGLSHSALEALSWGVPVVATMGCNLGFIQDSMAGYSASYDPKDVSVKVEKIIKNNRLRNTFSNNAKNIISSFYSTDIVLKTYEKVYEKTLINYQ